MKTCVPPYGLPLLSYVLFSAVSYAWFLPRGLLFNLSRTIRKQKKTVLVRTVFLFAISISLFRISTADKAFSIFLACVNFLFHSESMRRET
ncbi:hypothetical protein C5O26_02885 [Bacillus velezensis]|nr:hypothetical protein C5O26_02885 [Bacillus velezensis]